MHLDSLGSSTRLGSLVSDADVVDVALLFKSRRKELVLPNVGKIFDQTSDLSAPHRLETASSLGVPNMPKRVPLLASFC